jgi:hypothetical protein
LSDYYRCVEDYFEELERVHEERYQARFGYLRPEIRLTIFRYLDCGCLQNGFARVKCDDPGCACSIQTFGDFLGFNPHCHIIISDGTFDEQGNFPITSHYDAHALEQLFRHKVLKMLLEKGAITQWHIDLLMSWHHSGFNVHVCDPIAADDRDALEKLAHYIIRCQFSRERMTYLEDCGTVIYRSKDGHTTKSFTALDWLAMIISHIPRHGEQMVRYYGYYSNAARGKRRKFGMDDSETPEILGQEADIPYRNNCRAN